MSKDYDLFTLFGNPELRARTGSFMKQVVSSIKERDKKIKENSEIFLREFGIKYCPVHTSCLVEKVEPDVRMIEFYGKDYTFLYTECTSMKLCQSNISFDDGLIKKIKENENLIEVQQTECTECVSCGSKEGKVYYTGFHIPFSSREGDINDKAIKLKQGEIVLGKHKLYLFERPCHTYLAANHGGLDFNQSSYSKS
ncbi:MAG: hypothetical protein U9R34_07780 [Nanoarchaeota archaeon]|nr:hypothetical protein [Nanoarchaeota archaeon]